MPVGTVKNGQIIGYKYFGFGGLKQAQKGLTPFAGTKKGNQTALNLFLTPKTDQEFKINVWLDGPWANKTWKGKKIGQIVVPAGSAQELTRFKLDVAKYVDGIGKKHAIYLVVEGPQGREELADIHGLGFSSKTKKIERPVAPKVTIKANGKALEIPQIPIRSTDENGLLGENDYEVKCKVDGEKLPKITASADNKQVKISILKDADSQFGSTVVECTYNNQVKRYHVKFEK
jgi:hypothetical protein